MTPRQREIRRKSYDKKHNESAWISCGCGCGQKLKSINRHGKTIRFINGHNGRKYKEPREYQRQYTLRNRERINKNTALWKKNKPWLNLAYVNAYRARMLKAMPVWSDVTELQIFYKNCPKGFHVDHIIPLKNNNVCGLHVIHNLQYLTITDNLRKGNKFE